MDAEGRARQEQLPRSQAKRRVGATKKNIILAIRNRRESDAGKPPTANRLIELESALRLV
jgi:hypothetical protein